jgi:hypothetical protein
MSGSVYERVYEVRDDVVTAVLSTQPEGVDLLIFPDKLFETREGKFAGYREETQSVRVFLREHGLRIQLASPPDTKAVSYEEHDVTWVLPLVVSIVGGAGANVISHYLLRWLERRKGELRETEGVKVRYREGELDLSKGKLTVRELEAPLGALMEALNEERESLPPS